MEWLFFLFACSSNSLTLNHALNTFAFTNAKQELSYVRRTREAYCYMRVCIWALSNVQGFGGHQWQNPSIASYCYSLLANLHLGGPVLWRYQLERISGRKLVPCRRPLPKALAGYPFYNSAASFIVFVLRARGHFKTKGQHFFLETF